MSPQLTKYAKRRELYDRREFRFGQIYIIDDELINLPASDRIGKRVTHHDRWVVVVSNNDENIQMLAPTVTVAPLSHRTDLKREFDLEIFKDSDCVKDDSLIILKAMQPVCKVDLRDHQGEISNDKKEELLALIQLYYGLSGDE
ncbi:MAG: PemK-like protein [Pelotomaculum sp. PtaB.Bin104]|nr:MAG: PemK-like protein [Pelotomaculum sp. PtaB.Bin104]